MSLPNSTPTPNLTPTPNPINLAALMSELRCPVCFEPCIEPMVGLCGHTACRSCLWEWLRSNKTCLMCRKPMTKSSVGKNLVVESILTLLGFSRPPRVTDRLLRDSNPVRQARMRNAHSWLMFSVRNRDSGDTRNSLLQAIRSARTDVGERDEPGEDLRAIRERRVVINNAWSTRASSPQVRVGVGGVVGVHGVTAAQLRAARSQSLPTQLYPPFYGAGVV